MTGERPQPCATMTPQFTENCFSQHPRKRTFVCRTALVLPPIGLHGRKEPPRALSFIARPSYGLEIRIHVPSRASTSARRPCTCATSHGSQSPKQAARHFNSYGQASLPADPPPHIKQARQTTIHLTHPWSQLALPFPNKAQGTFWPGALSDPCGRSPVEDAWKTLSPTRRSPGARSPPLYPFVDFAGQGLLAQGLFLSPASFLFAAEHFCFVSLWVFSSLRLLPGPVCAAPTGLLLRTYTSQAANCSAFLSLPAQVQ